MKDSLPLLKVIPRTVPIAWTGKESWQLSNSKREAVRKGTERTKTPELSKGDGKETPGGRK